MAQTDGKQLRSGTILPTGDKAYSSLQLAKQLLAQQLYTFQRVAELFNTVIDSVGSLAVELQRTRGFLLDFSARRYRLHEQSETTPFVEKPYADTRKHARRGSMRTTLPSCRPSGTSRAQNTSGSKWRSC